MKKILACLAAAALLAGAYGVRIVSAGITCNLPFQLQNNTTADATQVMANYNALVTCFTNAAAAGVNNDITSLIGLTTPLSPSSGGSASYFTSVASGGSAASQSVASLTPTGFTLAAGREVTFTPGFTNTGLVTVNVEGSGAVALWRNTTFGPGPAIGGELVVGNLATIKYDGTHWVIQGPPVRVGEIFFYAGTTVPPGYITAAGAVLNIASDPPLFAALGTTYGGDGITTYGIPDYRGRGVAGVDGGTGRATNCGSGVLAGTCGVGSTAITQAMMTDFALNLGGVGVSITDPGHTHGIPSGTTAVGAPTGLAMQASNQTTSPQSEVAGTGISAGLTGTGFAGGGGAGLSLWTPTAIVQVLIKL